MAEASPEAFPDLPEHGQVWLGLKCSTGQQEARWRIFQDRGIS
jgi:hypothetical protein